MCAFVNFSFSILTDEPPIFSAKFIRSSYGLSTFSHSKILHGFLTHKNIRIPTKKIGGNFEFFFGLGHNEEVVPEEEVPEVEVS